MKIPKSATVTHQPTAELMHLGLNYLLLQSPSGHNLHLQQAGKDAKKWDVEVKIQDLLINYTEEVIHVLWSVHGDSSSLWLISLMWFSHAWLCSVWVWRFQSEVSLRTRELRLSMWLSRSSVSSSCWSSPPSSCNVEECRLEIILVARTTLESDYIIMMTYWPSFNVSAYLNVLYV